MLRQCSVVFASALVVMTAVVAEDKPLLVGASPAATALVVADPAIAEGKCGFERSCTACHEADRSLGQRKDLDEWRSVVTRMSQKQGANIPAADIEGIAAYLASQCPPGPSGPVAAKSGASSITPFATVSPSWRFGSPNIQNNGLFPEAFVGVQWQQPNGPLSARVTACTACHGAGEPGFLQRIELVEAVVRVNTSKTFSGCPVAVQSAVEAGRFVVPFGAFSAQVNPGVYRTVSKPLIFNMGQRVHDGDIGDPVLPMPFSDEGVNLNFSVPVGPEFNATLDAYLVNGLIGDENGIDFDRSREMLDNNSAPSAGARATFGNQFVRVGGSALGGRFNDRPISGPFDAGMQYFIWGVDCTAHYEDLVRLQAEYAHRGNDRILTNDVGDTSKVYDRVGGYYLEGEFRPEHECPVSLLARYDRQSRRDATAPEESVLPDGRFSVSRVTWGFNFQLFHQSLLMINHEHWFMPTGLHSVDAFGMRYAISF